MVMKTMMMMAEGLIAEMIMVSLTVMTVMMQEKGIRARGSVVEHGGGGGQNGEGHGGGGGGGGGGGQNGESGSGGGGDNTKENDHDRGSAQQCYKTLLN